jgi:hypothetical protein
MDRGGEDGSAGDGDESEDARRFVNESPVINRWVVENMQKFLQQ